MGKCGQAVASVFVRESVLRPGFEHGLSGGNRLRDHVGVEHGMHRRRGGKFLEVVCWLKWRQRGDHDKPPGRGNLSSLQRLEETAKLNDYH